MEAQKWEVRFRRRDDFSRQVTITVLCAISASAAKRIARARLVKFHTELDTEMYEPFDWTPIGPAEFVPTR